MCKELRPAERDTLYYLRTTDPYSNGIDITITQIANDLGRDKGTISRALQVLAGKGLIDIELVQVKVKVSSKGLLCSMSDDVVPTQPGCPDTTPVAYTQPQLSPHNTSCADTTPVAYTQQAEPETQTQQGVEKPKTYKTLKTIKDSSERQEEILKVWEEFSERLKIYAIYSRIWVGENLIDNPEFIECVRISRKHDPNELRRRLIAFCLRIKDFPQIKDKYAYLKSFLQN